MELDRWRQLDEFYESLPAGLFSMDPYEAFLDSFGGTRLPLWTKRSKHIFERSEGFGVENFRFQFASE